MLRHACFLVFGAVFGSAMPAFAFDTGYHWDATMSAYDRSGLSNRVAQVSAVTNWMTDYYSAFPGAAKQHLTHLHFDNMSDTASSRHNYEHLLNNTYDALKDLRQTNPKLDYKTSLRVWGTIGIASHAMQDFYTHTNWRTFYPQTATEYATNTYLSSGAPEAGVLQSGFYTNPRSCPSLCNNVGHGGYFNGLNKDSQIRSGWDAAHVFSFAESMRMLDWLRTAPELGGLLDEAARVIDTDMPKADVVALEQDAKAAFEISMFIALIGHDGHWKGNKSGALSKFAKAQSGWSARKDSVFVDLFREHEIYLPLVRCLYDYAGACANPDAKHRNTSTVPGFAASVIVTHYAQQGSSLFEPDYVLQAQMGDLNWTDRIIADTAQFDPSENQSAFWVMGFIEEAQDMTIELWQEHAFQPRELQKITASGAPLVVSLVPNSSNDPVQTVGKDASLTYILETHTLTER